MFSYHRGWDKPILEVNHLIWRHRTSTQNNVETSCLVWVFHLFCTFWDKNEKNNQSPRWGRDNKNLPRLCAGTGKSTQVSKICSPRRGLPSRGHCKSLTRGWINRIYHHTMEGTRESHPSVHDCNPRQGLPSLGFCKSWTRGWDSLVPSTMWWLIIFLPRLLFLINNPISTL